ncbi:MAG: hypothetical protein QNI87_07905 [Erythrobacter sp.]|uniref:hypothetical protein n=1 Tax=Erythrobacter sp. TaxID=1042 RepID=UPI002632BE23|nr:hypothetical protein [Erythrobacter sp.]MDJ0978446.1 hypothetical protein [Erythrobacter sp.]
MKTTAFAALLILGAATPAMADSPMETTDEAVAKLSIDNSIEELMANEVTAAVLLKHIPGIDEHPAYGQFKGMSLIELQPWSAGAVTDEIIAAVKADLEALA